MADASDSKSDAGNSVWVQVPSPALIHLLKSLENSYLKVFFLFMTIECSRSVHSIVSIKHIRCYNPVFDSFKK